MRFVKVNSDSVTSMVKKLERNCVACSKASIKAPHEAHKDTKSSNLNHNGKSRFQCVCANILSKILNKNILSAAKANIKKIRLSFDKKYTSALAVTALSCGLMILFNAKFSFAYNAFFNGTDLGFVPDKTYVENAIAKINTEFAEYVSGENIITGNAVYAPAIIRKNAFTHTDTLEEAIKSTSDVMVKAYSIEINGKAYTALESQEEAQSVLNTLLCVYKTDDNTQVSFGEEVYIVNQYVPASALMSADNAAERVGSFATVISADTLSYEQEVPFTEEVTEDSSMYEGAEKILQKGKNGTNEITEKIVRRNGKIESTTVLSNVCVAAPQTQLRAVGTMERPYNMGTGTFLRPYYGTISSRFGSRRSGNHTGVDFCGDVGDPIIAADTGTVIFSGWSGGYGKVIKIDHNNGYITYYAHCNSLNAQVGDVVKKGQTIATVGSTGNSTGPHVHFEIRHNGEVCNPMNYVD